MYKSNYNIFIPKENLVIGFNSFTNSFVALSSKLYNDFLLKEVNEFAEIHSQSYEKLKECGFVIPDSLNELNMIRYKNKIDTYNSRKYHLVIFPTQDCNLKCWYCYESHVKDSKMNPNIIRRVINNVEKNIENNTFDSLNLTFFGGEPLTDFDHIAYPLASEIKNKVEKVGKIFDCFFVTNASLITDQTIDQLKEIKPKFQITLDGNREHHNKVRKWKYTNEGTYDSIMMAIHKIVENIDNGNFLITLRINYDNNTLQGVKDILEDIKDIDRRKLFIHFERVWQTQSQVDDEQRSLLKNSLELFIKQGFIVNIGVFRVKNYSCPADTLSYPIINYNGAVYKCNGRTLLPGSDEGELKEDGTILWNDNKLSLRIGLSTFENNVCLKCKMLPLCMGPCSQKLLENNNKFNDKICSMHSIDLPLKEYLSLAFETQLQIYNYEHHKM